MGFRHCEIKGLFRGMPLVAALMLVLVAFLCPVASSATPEVELYQNEQGQWELKYLNAQPANETSPRPSVQEAQQADTETTEVELYQDEKGEWKVRYLTFGEPVAEPSVSEPASDHDREDETSHEDVLAAEVILDNSPLEDSDFAEEEPTFETVDDDQDDRFKELAGQLTSETVKGTSRIIEKEPVAIKDVKPAPKKTAVSTTFQKKNQPVYMHDDHKSSRNPNRQWEAGVSFSSYKFEQEDYENNLGRMNAKTNEGNLVGLHLGYEHVLTGNGPYVSLMDAIKNIDDLSRYKVTVDYHTGKTEYSNIGWPVDDGDYRQHILEAKAVAGYDFMIKGHRLTPFMGIGYRYVRDPSGDVLDIPDGLIDSRDDAEYRALFNNDLFIVRGYYLTQLHAFYIPVGLMTNSDITDTMSLGLNLEMDYVFLGLIHNSFEELGEVYDEDAGPRTKRIEDLNNDLKGGIGLKGSVRLTKKQKLFDLYVEPYVHYWWIRRNEEQYRTLGSDDSEGIIYQDSAPYTKPYKHIEPESSTTEYGIQIGLAY